MRYHKCRTQPMCPMSSMDDRHAVNDALDRYALDSWICIDKRQPTFEQTWKLV